MPTYTLTYAVLENDKVYKFYANDYCVIETLYGLLKNSGLYYGICLHQLDDDGSERTYILKK